MSEHADLEALSAFVDGEAPEWADHVAGCATCRASADQLRSVAAAVGVPVEPPSAREREVAVAAALENVDRRAAAEQARFARRRPDRRLQWASVAAVLLVGIVGISAALTLSGGSPDRTTVAGPAPEPAPMAGDLSGPGAGELYGRSTDSAAAGVPPTDLGDVPDAATLRARAGPALGATADAGRSAASANSGAAGSATAGASGGAGGAAANVQGGASAGANVAPVPNVVGTRPCEEQARTRDPSLREVVFYATARQGDVPAVVLGFTTGPSVTLLLLAQEGCAELLRAAGP